MACYGQIKMIGDSDIIIANGRAQCGWFELL